MAAMQKQTRQRVKGKFILLEPRPVKERKWDKRDVRIAIKLLNRGAELSLPPLIANRFGYAVMRDLCLQGKSFVVQNVEQPLQAASSLEKWIQKHKDEYPQLNRVEVHRMASEDSVMVYVRDYYEQA